MNPLSDLERLVAAIEKQGANIAPTYQVYADVFAIANDCGRPADILHRDLPDVGEICLYRGG